MSSGNVEMTRYWIVASSKNDPLHRYDGTVVLAPKEGNPVRAYVMDLSVPNTSMMVDRKYLARWHPKEPNHEHCYCKRVVYTVQGEYVINRPQPCFCDTHFPDSNPYASCGDCPTKDYKV